MDIDQLSQILGLVDQHDLAELEIEHEGLKLRIRKETAGSVVLRPAPSGGPPSTPVAAGPASVVSGTAVSVLAASSGDEIELAVVKSPIVGTFYRSPEPSAPSFVETGSVVKKGQVLCIIEAMKLMNQIDSEYDGEIVTIYVENGQPVQYGERLFAIKTT